MAAEASACTGSSSTFSPIIVGSVDQLSPSGSFCAMKTTVRPEPTCVAVTVTAESRPASRCCWMRANGTASVMSCSMADGSTRPTPCCASAEMCGGRPMMERAEGEELAAIDREHAVDGEVRPDVDEPAGARARVVGERGQAAGVERADRGAAQDVERRIAADVARDILEDVLDDADLVGAAAAPPASTSAILPRPLGAQADPRSQGHPDQILQGDHRDQREEH